jgi:signal peptidase I
MYPTLVFHDHFFVGKASFVPRHGDIIVFEHPEEPGTDFVKRVVGLPGDVITVDDGALVINGKPVPRCEVGEAELGEPPDSWHGTIFVEYLDDRAYLTFVDGEAPAGFQGPYLVARDEYWVLGDNRNLSSDSRSWNEGRGRGVPRASIKGRAWRIWMSFREGHTDTTRIWTDVHGSPTLPTGASERLHDGLRRCLEAHGLASG